MAARLRRYLQTTAALAAAVVTFTLVTLPPRARQLPGVPPEVVFGAYHVHTTLSDGSGTVDEVALAASRVGLKFLLLTDHGDATRVPAPPAYRHGVLVVDNVEISTNAGHLVALGLTSPAPYPLGGEGSDVIDDVHRLGGWAVIAHPDSPKPDLRWRARDTGADGIEWLNEDSEWRGATWEQITNALLHAPLRGAESLAAIMAPPTASLRRWDLDQRNATVVGLSAADAHGVLGGRTGGQAQGLHVGTSVYEMVFHALAQAVILDRPLSGHPVEDARAVLAAVRAGRTFSIVTGFGAPGTIDFTADDGTSRATMGERLTPAGSAVTIRATVPNAPDATLVLLRGGREVISGLGTVRATVGPERANYRVEAFLGTHALPWIVSNPIYVGAAPPDVITPVQPDASTSAVSLTQDAAWRIERRAPAAAQTDVADGGRALRFQLGDLAVRDQYVALVRDLSANRAACDQVILAAHAAHPMRVWLQLRFFGSTVQRWGASIYLDASTRTVVVPLRDLLPIGFSATRRPIAAEIQSILFVVDRTNTAANTSGEFWISDLRLGNSGRPSGPDGE